MSIQRRASHFLREDAGERLAREVIQFQLARQITFVVFATVRA